MPVAPSDFKLEAALPSSPRSATPTWWDLSEFLRDIPITRRGRQHELNEPEAGTTSVLFDNCDRSLDPTYTGSRFYPYIVPRKRLRLSVVFSSTTYYLFDVHAEAWPPEWEGPSYSESLVPCSDRLALLANDFLASTYASLTTALTGSNNDLVYTAVSPGPGGNAITVAYVVSGLNTALSVSVSVSAITVNVATNGAGAATSTAAQVAAAIAASPSAAALVMTANAGSDDGTGVVTALAATALSGATFPQELTGARVGRVLDSVGWPAADRVISPGMSLCQPATFLAHDKMSAFQHLRAVARTEKAVMFVDGRGRFVFRDRPTRLKAPYTVSQATFGDGGGTELDYEEAKLFYDSDYLYNTVAVADGQGAAVTVTDAVSEEANWPSTYSEDTLLPAGSLERNDAANYLLAQYKDPRYRFDRLEYLANIDDAHTLQAVTRDLGDRITVKKRPPGGGAVISQDCIIEAIQHRISFEPALRWLTTYELSPADTATYALLDTMKTDNANAKLAY